MRDNKTTRTLATLAVAAILLAVAMPLGAQDLMRRTTEFARFRPAVIVLNNGSKMKKMANIFLRNGSLVYKRGNTTMLANTQAVARVEFDSATYVRIDTLLAAVVDTAGGNTLYRSRTIDLEAYQQMVYANRQITSVEISDFVNVSSVDLNAAEDVCYPVRTVYYMTLGGKTVRVHERTLWPLVPKARRRLYRTLLSMPDFSWTDPAWLKRLMRDCFQ